MSEANNVETFRWKVSSYAPATNNTAPPGTDASTTLADDVPLYRGYRVPSTRFRHWDYTANAFYFVTICTRERLPLLGEVVNGQVILSQAGRIVGEEWRQTAGIRPDVLIDEYVVMPNHLHGIIVLNRAETRLSGTPNKTSRRDVSTPGLAAGSLGAIIGQFKGACTKRIRAAWIADFGWQPRFYDHIIRDEKSLDSIRRYIADNPLKWELEHDTPENIWM